MLWVAAEDYQVQHDKTRLFQWSRRKTRDILGILIYEKDNH